MGCGRHPKDGPSAGVATLCVLASQVNVRSDVDVAMLGDITIRGVVLPVGGISRKRFSRPTEPALRRVILPHRNTCDINEDERAAA